MCYYYSTISTNYSTSITIGTCSLHWVPRNNVLFNGVLTWRSLCVFDGLPSLRPETRGPRLLCSGLCGPERGERCNNIARWYGFEFEFRFHRTADRQNRGVIRDVVQQNPHTYIRYVRRRCPANLFNTDEPSSGPNEKTFGTKRFFFHRGRAHYSPRYYNKYVYCNQGRRYLH